MKKFTLAIITTLFFVAALFSSQKASASHCAGGQITYQWMGDSTYKFTFKFYRDCSGTTVGNTFDLCYYSDCNPGGSTTTMTQVGLPVQVVTPCPGYTTTCSPGAGTGASPNYEEYTYEATIYNLARCNAWHFYTFLNARNASSNITAGTFFVEATLNNSAGQGNSSSIFTVRPVPFACVNVPYTFNNGASDPNNDSLSFELINPLNYNPISGCTYPASVSTALNAGYNLTNNPFATNNTFTLSPTTGQLGFTAANTGSNTVALLVKEWRNGVVVGSVVRDIQVRVKASGCSPQPVVIPQPGLSTGVVFPTLATDPYYGCAGQTLNLCTRITSADTLAWLAVNSNNAAVANGSVMNYTGIGTDTVIACLSWTPPITDTGLRILTFTVRDTNCISNGGVASSQTFSVPLYIHPTTIASHDTTICFGDTARLSAVGGGSYIWTALPGGSSAATSLSCDTCRSLKAFPTVTTRYVVTSNLTSYCNGNKDTVTVFIAPVPTFNAGPDTTTCINNSLQLNANVALPAGTYSIQWTPSTYLSKDTIVNPIVTPTNDISYVIRVVPGTAGACALYDTLKVNVVKGYDLITGDQAICEGSSVTINLTGDTRYSYVWSPAQGVSNINSMTPTITPDTSKRYTVTASFPGCRDSVRSLYIDVQPALSVFIGIDKTLCYGDTVHMDMATVTPASYPYYTYSWTPAGNFDDPTRLHPVFQGFSTTTLKLTATTPAGCTGDASVTYTIIPADFLVVSADTAICPGDTAQLHVTGTYTSLSWTPTSYINTVTGPDPKVWPVSTTTYAVVGTDANSCLDTQRIEVTVNPHAVLSLPDSVTIFPGESYSINPGGNCLYFTWFPLAGLSNGNIANPVASPPVNTRYHVTGVTEGGCRVTDSMDVNVSLDSWIDVPNAFSPGSQPNAIFKIVHRGTVKVKSFKVFNRWGAEMFSTTDVSQGWDGSLNGTPQPMGVYVYIVEAVTPTGRQFYKQGNVTLIR